MALLHELVDRAGRTWPDRTAVSTAAESIDWVRLAAASRRLAGWLSDLGLQRGQRVLFTGPAGPVIPALCFASSRLGTPFAVLHEATRGAALAHVLADAEPALLVADDPSALESARAAGVPTATLAQAAEYGLDGPIPEHLPEPISVDPLCLIYTSGTTDRPKAVVSTHQQAVFAVDAIQSMLGYRPDDVVYCPLPLSFDYGLYQVFLGAASGAHIRLGTPAEAGPGLLRTMVRAEATVLASMPAVAHTLARLIARNPVQLPPLRLLTNTGAAMPPETLSELRAGLPRLRVQLMFGLTECKRAAIMPPDADLDRPGACGVALPGTEIMAIDTDGNRLPAGQIGELVVRGANVMTGYWRRPELTAQKFHRVDGLFPELRTGDHGWLDEDGYVYFVGRLDDIYKERGFRVSATEVEAAARRVPGVDLAAVLPPLDGQPSVLAVVTGSTADAVLLRLRAEIEEFKIPRQCVVVDRLPLTRNGKVDRAVLRAEVSHD
ncbi:MAG TPA: class I adenylate-forming enzyme family protein [Pseudonocardia sp.]